MQGDHLGSSSLVMTSSGTLNTRQTYFPYGAKRVFDGSALPTDYTFTGQKSDDSTGLMFYNARYYDATVGRFTQADSIIPNVMDPQSWNRYAYTLNNPVRYTDPTGHMVKDEDGGGGGGGDGEHDSDVEQTTVVVTPENANDYYHPATDSGSEPTPNDNTSDVLHDKVCDVFENPDPHKATGQAIVELIAQGYDPNNDHSFGAFSDTDKAEIVYWHFMWRLQNDVKSGKNEIDLAEAIEAVSILASGSIRGAPSGMGDAGGPTAGKRITGTQRLVDLAANQAANPRGHYWCTNCGFENSDAAMFQDDHIIPKSQGGNTNANNRRILCVGCNTSAQEGWPPKAGSDWATKYPALDMQPK